MKLPITDKFLWFLYNCVEKMDRVHHNLSGARSIYQIVYPDAALLHKEYERQKARRGFGQFVKYLCEKGYIKTKALEGTEGIMLTPKGLEKALRAKYKLTERKKRKDGNWIMIIFDIPEKERKNRKHLRDALINLGYQQLQKSVWVCPYDVYKETEAAVRTYRTTSYVKIFLIKELA